MKQKIVWTFTNKRQLTAQEFVRYFEKKVRATIRKYQMPISKIQSRTVKAQVLNKILEKLPPRKGSLALDTLTNISNKILYTLMYSKQEQLKTLLPKNQPFYFLSDKEIALYAKLTKTKGKLKQDTGKLKQINSFIESLEQKNPDARHNIINALLKANNRKT